MRVASSAVCVRLAWPACWAGVSAREVTVDEISYMHFAKGQFSAELRHGGCGSLVCSGLSQKRNRSFAGTKHHGQREWPATVYVGVSIAVRAREATLCVAVSVC